MKKNSYNALEYWKSNTYVNSSDFTLSKKFVLEGRNNLDQIITDFERWFGMETFIIERKEIHEPHRDIFMDGEWLNALLFSQNLKSVQTVIEIWKVIKHHETIEPARLSPLISHRSRKDSRQFRNYYFELYVFYILDISGFETEFKVYEGALELEGTVKIGNEVCLVECRKLYYNKREHLKMNADLMHKIVRYVYRNPLGITIAISYKGVDRKAVDKVMKFIKQQILDWKNEEMTTIYLPKRIIVDRNIEVELFRYADGTFEGLKTNMESDNYVIAEINPVKLTDGTNRTMLKLKMENRVMSTDAESRIRFMRALEKKRRRRTNSSYKTRIYAFDSEQYPGFDRGLFIFDGYDGYTRKKVKEYIGSKQTSDIVMMFLRESNDVKLDRVRLRVDFNSNSESVAKKLLHRIKY